MTAVTFDTLAYVKRLEDVGFSRRQAEIQVEIQVEMLHEQRKILEERDTRLADKSDLRETELRLQAEIEKVRAEGEKIRAELKTDMKSLELRLLKWQFGIGLALAAIMAKGFGWLGF